MGMTRSGALAEYIVVPAASLTPMPDGVAPEAAAAFRANYLTALYALPNAARSSRAKSCWCWARPAASALPRCRSAS